MKSERKETLSVRIDPKLLQLLDQLCERSGLSRTEMVERCLEWGLHEQEDIINKLERPILGEIMHAMTQPAVLKVIIPLLGGEVDERQLKLRDNIERKRRQRGTRAKPAME